MQKLYYVNDSLHIFHWSPQSLLPASTYKVSPEIYDAIGEDKKSTG